MKTNQDEWNAEFFPTLSERAIPPDGVIPATSIKPDIHSNTISLSFRDNTCTTMKVQELKSLEDAMLISLGQGLNISLQEQPQSCQLMHLDDAPNQLKYSTHQGHLSMKITEALHLEFHHKIKPLLQSVGEEYLVGDVPQAYPLAKYKAGYQMSFGIGYGELFYGGGEDFVSIVKNGRSIDIANRDALGVGGEHRYQSTPVFYSNKGYIISQISAAPSRWDFGANRNEVLTITSASSYLALLIIPCKNPIKGIYKLRSLFRKPQKAPDWSFGNWMSRCYYKDQKTIEKVLSEGEQNNIPIDVINLDARAWMRANQRTDFVWDETRFEPYQILIPKLLQKGVRICLWESPYVSIESDLFKEGEKHQYFAKNSEGKPYKLEWIPAGLEGFPQTPPAGLVDFTNPAACDWWQDLHRPLLRAGVAAFKTDFGEEIPPDAIFFDGNKGFEIRNKYADLYNQTVSSVVHDETGGEGVLWARSGHMETASTPVKWAGDSQTTWRALRSTLKAGLSQSIGGAIFWSHDIGGFYGPPPTPELYQRWAQLALWCSHVRFHGTSAREPWVFGDETLATLQISLKLRHHLLPWFIKLANVTTRESMSFISPLWLHHPENKITEKISDQFYVGRQVIVAPILESSENGESRSVYLPEGEWLDLINAKVRSGGKYFRVQYQKQIPVFYKLGTGDDALFQSATQIIR